MSTGSLKRSGPFVTAWSSEFTKAVEMFSGVTVTATVVPEVETDGPSTPDDMVWQLQTFELGRTGTLWLGAPRHACDALTDKLADDAPGREAIFRETLRTSFQGAARVMSAATHPGMVCAVAKDEQSLPPDSLPVERVAIVSGQTRHLLSFVLDDAFAEICAASAVVVPDEEAEPDAVVAPPTSFERFVGVELPVVVVLGRAALRIRDVLNLTIGSLIELDRHVNEPVEITVHDTVVARGEVVSVRGNYGVRILEVVTRKDRSSTTVPTMLRRAAIAASGRAH
jgi:flagellar motor switch protein FliN